MTTRTTRRSFLKRATLASTALALGAHRITAGAVPSTGLPYSAKEIAGRLGISMAVFQKERLGARHVAAIRAAGIRHIELTMIPQRFDVQDRAQVAEILTECRRQKVAIVSVHGNLQRKYNDPDDQKRRVAAAHLLDEIRFAEEAGANILVAHFGTNDQSRKTVTELLEQTKDLRVRLTVENMRGALKPYTAFVEKIGSKRFGLTVDIGHLRDADGVNPLVKQGRAGEVFAQGAKRIWHLHLHETFDLETKPDHRAPMHPDGIIEWGEVFAALKAIDYRGIFLFEDGRGENPKEWVRLAATFPQNFVSRYGR
ncbi:MAG: sugar phosphate isomerase/epimerase family protein [Planctomycetota bacterium]|jgi:sugar phosphate isomerase/epimerase